MSTRARPVERARRVVPMTCPPGARFGEELVVEPGLALRLRETANEVARLTLFPRTMFPRGPWWRARARLAATAAPPVVYGPDDRSRRRIVEHLATHFGPSLTWNLRTCVLDGEPPTIQGLGGSDGVVHLVSVADEAAWVRARSCRPRASSAP